MKAGETIRCEVQFLSVTGDALTGATVTVTIYKDDVLQVSGAAATERSAGRYSYDVASAAAGRWVSDFSTADTDADVLTVSQERIVVAADYYETDISSLATAAALATTDGKIDDLTLDVYNLTHRDGEEITRVIPPPASSDSCVIYALCYDKSSHLPLESVTATARIMELPYYKDGKYHEGDTLTGAYVDGVCSWDIVQGAVVSVTIKELGGTLGRGTVPEAESADVYTFLEI